tara:strand:+ start:1513 stop:2241 length:729 start_codon:yes stop_codon:yes gene_type:complete
MVLYLIGIGLSDEKDITLKGLDVIKKCSKIYLEHYTSKLNCNIKSLEKLYKKKIKVADRELIESGEDIILSEANKKNIALLIIGDVFSATTHINFLIKAKKLKTKVVVVNNASIISAIGVVGLELYKYGKITSIPFENKNVKTPYTVLKSNLKNGLHTLFLLDLDVTKNKFMTVNDAIKYLLEQGMENKLCVGCSALGSEKPEIKAGKVKDLLKHKFKKYPQCLIIPGKLHFIEEEALRIYN